MELVGIIENVRSLHNIGSIFRTADSLGVTKLYLTESSGYPHPDQPWRRDHLSLQKTALGAEQTVVWEYLPETHQAIQRLRDEGYTIIALEITPDALPLRTLDPIESKIALIVGNEVTGVSATTLQMSDLRTSIPMRGQKESLNVSIAFAIAAYSILND